MLWKKESNGNDSMYVDLYALNGGRASFDKVDCFARQGKPSSTFNKNGVVSLQKRNEGDKYFSQGKWTRAMELYGESLCYAEHGSKNVNLAYANRSACFLKMKRYNECLIDIELAKEAGYPANLIPQLDQRKEECLKAIDEGAQPVMFEPKLSFEPNENFPCMANVLKIDRDAQGDLGIFAKEHIDVGQTIVVEKAFMTYLYTHHGWKCNICLKEYGNFVPCKKCTVAMFCSEECQGNSLHKYECGLRYSDSVMMNGFIMRVVRGCLLAIDMFSDADELMTFVEQAISSDRNQIPSTLLDEKSQYEAFLKLPIKPASTEHHEFMINLTIAFSAQKLLMRIPRVNSMFKLEKYRRFFMHFITHQYQVMENNSFICGSNHDDMDDDYVPFESRTGLMIGYKKHSCAPNVMVSRTVGHKFGLITVRPVMKGQQILHAVIVPLLTLSKRERHQILWQDRKMLCKCARCEGVTASKVLCKRIQSDPDYQYITQQSIPPTRGDDDAKQSMQTMIDKCERFLRQYGQTAWCNEFGRVVTIYMTLVDRQ
ncbi:SET and MYND domain-containing protein 4-like [Sitodiplosis mosellana]|uniref:SET and MYND domain-containing protein 4-like n=1 Tax=Sitodiplosis mosellana TaxID=263140 RepID=UPI002443FD68|nr:SET and MYND domain-containing protein 4-like [Sitodiplosis mosellana]